MSPPAMTAAKGSSLLRNYLTPAHDACWRWDATGESVVWRDGSTIAFYPEIILILRHLSEQGWPSFNALVLLLAACRSTWHAVADANLANAKSLVQEAAQREPIVLLWFTRCLSGLQAVAELPAQLRESAEARVTLCRSVFGTGPVGQLSAETVGVMLPFVPDVLGHPPSAIISEHTRWWPAL
ncbi:MAG TPA: hypothetical protein VHX44_10855, partial [Planctomycetota bacterium]|nr:hypothetical protein [Planctomycetota bacterium]